MRKIPKSVSARPGVSSTTVQREAKKEDYFIGNREIKPVIVVAKDKEFQLHTIGKIASFLFPCMPNVARERVLYNLKLKSIPFLELRLDIRDLPQYLGCWYWESAKVKLANLIQKAGK